MTDTRIKGTGNSRSIRSVPNLAALAPTYDALLALLTSENGLPVDIGQLNPAGCDVVGTANNKANLLSDATAALYGLGSGATVDRAFYKNTKMPFFQVDEGTYVGTDGPLTLTCNFYPMFFFVSADDPVGTSSYVDCLMSARVFNGSSVTGDTVSQKFCVFYNDQIYLTRKSGTKWNFNAAGEIYHYAIYGYTAL